MALNLTIFSSASPPIWANKKEKVWLLHPLAQMDVPNRTTLTYKGNNPHLDAFLTTMKTYARLLCGLFQARLGQRTSHALPYLILQITNHFPRIWCMCALSSVLAPEPNVGWGHPVSAEHSQQQAYPAYPSVKVMNLQVFSHIRIHFR